MSDSSKRQGRTIIDLDGKTLEPAAMLQLSRLGHELRLMDQILSLDVDSLSILATGPAPAWTSLDGSSIHFSMKHMPFPKTRYDLAVWLGTNAHELIHVFRSPREDSTLIQRLIVEDRMFMPGLMKLHNIAEDQRGERWLLGRFAPWRPFLIAALGHHLKVDGDDAWLLITGRTWLSAQVRDAARARFVKVHGQAAETELTTVIGHYQRLDDPGEADADEAYRLLVRLHDLFGSSVPNPGCTVLNGAGDPDTGEVSDQAPGAADEGEDDDQGDDGDGDDASDDGDGDGAQGDAASDDSDDKGDDGSTQGDSSTGAGRGQDGPLDPSKIKEALREQASKQLESDEDSKSDLDSIVDALQRAHPGEGVQGNDSPGLFEPASDRAVRLRYEVARALLDLKDQSEAGWVRHTDKGRLNVHRVLNPRSDPDEWFDRYEPGVLDAAEMEVVLLLDVSISMAGSELPLGEAAWAIRQAVNDLEGRCTTLTWSDGPHRVMAQADDPVDDRMFVPYTGNGTEPSSALEAALLLLADSEARNRLMIVLTDGQWVDHRRHGDLIEAMNAQGIVTVCALLGQHAGDDLHGCQYGAHIGKAQELPALFERVAEEQIRRWL